MNNQTCIVCGTTKPITEFYKNPTMTNGHEGKCKICRKEYQKDWREQNRAKHRLYSRGYYRDHKDERSKYYCGWSDKNKEHKAQYDRDYRRLNPEQTLAQRKVDNARRRARLDNAPGSYTAKEWLGVKERYGNSCLSCGRIEGDVKITPDHVVPLSLGGSNSIENIQPLCWSCNARKQATIIDYRDGYKNQLPALA